MATVKLKIDVGDTVGQEAWRQLTHFEEIQSASFGPRYGSSGVCHHSPADPHVRGEWVGAEVKLQTPLLAQYAVSHYLKQPRVLDADVTD